MAKNLKKATLNIILELLEEGLIQAGCPREEDGFFKQKKGAPKNIVDDIKKEWNELDEDPSIGDIIWFYITEKGTKKLMELLMMFFQKNRRVQIE